MENPLISVIVPIFNVEKYVSECIESIQKQVYQNLQIILVNDGSTDNSGKICDKYAVSDSRIEVVHQQNRGLVAARKCGLEKANGEYIGFVDGDDYIEANMYQALVKEIYLTEADFVHSGFQDGSSKKYIFDRRVIDLSLDRMKLLKDTILGLEAGITPSIWSKLFKAELIKKTYNQIPEQYSLGEDFLNVCICILECDRIAFIDEAHYHYRIRSGSLSHKNDIHDLKDLINLYDGLNDILSSYGCYKQIANVADKFLWDNLLVYMDRINQYYFQISHYYFNDINRLVGKKIVIYGAAKVGRDYYAQISRYTDCEIVLWVDRCSEKYHYPHIVVHGVEKLYSTEFDIILIAVIREETANEIYSQLTGRGIDSTKIYWSTPQRYSLRSKEE